MQTIGQTHRDSESIPKEVLCFNLFNFPKCGHRVVKLVANVANNVAKFVVIFSGRHLPPM